MATTAQVPVEVEHLGAGHWSAKIGEVSVIGATPAQARSLLAAAIAEAMQGDYTPHQVSLADHKALVWRDPCGWLYQVRNEREPSRNLPTQVASREAAITQASHLLAQAVDGERVRAGLEPIGGQVLATEAEREDHHQWCRWQAGYAEGKKAGLSEQQCCVVADMRQHNTTRPEDREYYCRMEGAQPFSLPAEEITAARFRTEMDGYSELRFRDGHTKAVQHEEFRDQLAAMGPEGRRLHDQAVSHPWSWNLTARDPQANAKSYADLVRELTGGRDRGGLELGG